MQARWLIPAAVMAIASCAPVQPAGFVLTDFVKRTPDGIIAVTRPKVSRDSLSALVEAYPMASLRRREEGDVYISMCVSAEGAVSEVKLARSSGFRALDEATLKKAGSLVISPSLNADGKPVDFCSPPFLLAVSWRLPEAPPPDGG